MRLLDNSVLRFRLPGACGHSRFIAFGITAALVLLAPMAALADEVFFVQDCLPPLNSEYVGQFHQQYAAGLIDLRNPIHHRFTSCDSPPPMLGQVTNESFSSTVQFEVSTNGGGSYQSFQAPAQVGVRVGNSGPSGPATLFDTEMLQLDISGGTLPPGVMIRESPTQASLGKTTIRPVGGGFMIDSFFDVFTELSLDGGQSWQPSEGPPGRMVMQLPDPTPVRKSTWGQLKIMYR